MRAAEKSLVLQVLDQQWKDHLLHLDHLRQGIGLRAYGQRDPLNEYKSEAFTLFQAMLSQFRETVTTLLSHVEFQPNASDTPPPARTSLPANRVNAELATSTETRGTIKHHSPQTAGGLGPHASAYDVNDPTTWGKIGRNAPCPCESGKKFKHCHGAVT
jgi:preprotein translocase subunit SecA